MTRVVNTDLQKSIKQLANTKWLYCGYCRPRGVLQGIKPLIYKYNIIIYNKVAR